MIIKNAAVYRNGKFEEAESVYTDGPFFSDESKASGETVDAEGGYVIPGLIDIHFHGCDGFDFCDGTQEAIRRIAEYEIRHGITTINPATMTLPEKTLTEVMKAAKEYSRKKTDEGAGKPAAELAGIYMEGPFISEEKCGAQDTAYVRKPDAELLQRLQDASGGLIRVCTVAPEIEGSERFIDEVKDEIRLSAAHTAADYATAEKAFRKGVHEVTHLFNAMPPFHHREPGVIGAAMDNEQVMAELICDCVHVHPSMIRAAFRMFGADRIIMISDSMRATGLPDGNYTLGGQAVQVRGSRAALAKNGQLAGSVTNLFDCMKAAVQKAGIPLADAVRCTTENPARAIGIADMYGTIEKGKTADFLIMDRAMNIRKIVQHGTAVV